ncbi:MAG: hypothetical protein KDC39_06965 [Actinobacteria bacterium]|nr:hypothetical protein [Actinomycetota bacterium]
MSETESVDAPASERRGSDAAVPHSTDFVELWTTILLAIAAIATAWAGFQSAKWGGVQASSTAAANAARAESVRASTTAGQQVSIDANMFLSWMNSLVDDIDRGVVKQPKSAKDYKPTPGTISGFTYKRFRSEFQPAVRAWLNTDPFENPDAPSVPFTMDEYVLAEETVSEEKLAEADEKALAAAEANQNSDNYVISVVLFASALFFAALAGKLRRRSYSIFAASIGTTLVVGTLVYLTFLPIKF